MLSFKRKSFAFGHCLSTTTKPQIVDFDAAGLLGGIIKDGRKENDKYFESFKGLNVIAKYILKKYVDSCFTIVPLETT